MSNEQKINVMMDGTYMRGSKEDDLGISKIAVNIAPKRGTMNRDQCHGQCHGL